MLPPDKTKGTTGSQKLSSIQQDLGMAKQSTIWATTGKIQNGNVDEQDQISIAHNQFRKYRPIHMTTSIDKAPHVLSIEEKISNFRPILHELCEEENLRNNTCRPW